MKIFQKLIILLLFVLIPCSVQGYNYYHLYLDFKGGANLDGLIDYKPSDNLVWDSITPKPTIGFDYSVSLDLRLYKVFYLYGEYNWSSSSANWTIKSSDQNEINSYNTFVNLNSQNLMSGLKIRIYFLYLMSAYSWGTIENYIDPFFDYHNEEIDDLIPDYINKEYNYIDYGLGFNFKLKALRFLFEVHYSQGLSSIINSSSYEFNELVPGGFKAYFGLCLPMVRVK